MACSTCPKAKPAQKCATQLQIATTALLNTDVYVYFSATSLNDLRRFAATTDGGGVITLNTPAIALNTSYEVYVTEVSDDDQNNRVTLTLNQSGADVDTDCYLLTFVNPMDGDYPLIEIVLS